MPIQDIFEVGWGCDCWFAVVDMRLLGDLVGRIVDVAVEEGVWMIGGQRLASAEGIR